METRKPTAEDRELIIKQERDISICGNIIAERIDGKGDTYGILIVDTPWYSPESTWDYYCIHPYGNEYSSGFSVIRIKKETYDTCEKKDFCYDKDDGCNYVFKKERRQIWKRQLYRVGN